VKFERPISKVEIDADLTGDKLSIVKVLDLAGTRAVAVFDDGTTPSANSSRPPPGRSARCSPSSQVAGCVAGGTQAQSQRIPGWRCGHPGCGRGASPTYRRV
jgi:hypothetical protein